MIAGPRPENRVDYRLLLAILVFVTLIFLSLLHRLYQVRNPEHGDQAAYLELAYNIHAGRGFISRGLSSFMPRPEIEHPESVRAPLYPLLLSALADDSPGFFLRAKLITLTISLVVLLVSFLILSRSNGTFMAAIFVLLLAHNHPFQTYATEVWSENLLLVFCIPALFLIRHSLEEKAGRNPVRTGLITGCLLGLGYLTKVSAALILLCWIAVLGWSLIRRKVTRSPSPPAKGVLAAAAGFVATASPYLLWNRISIGRFFRDVDLRGAFWLDDGREYWIPHDSIPSAASYLGTHSPLEVLARLGHGFWRQGWNLVRATAASFSSGEAIGLLILGAALVGLACERSSRWRGFQILFLTVTLILAAWYATIDVDPRFIYLLIPLIIYNATLGLTFLVSRVAGNGGEGFPLTPKGQRWSLMVAGLLLISTVEGVFRPLEGSGYRISHAEGEAIRAIQRHVDTDEVLCMGPSHRLPYSWLIDRKTVFLPDYAEWNQISHYFDQYGVRALLLDQEIFLRRARLLGDYCGWNRQQGLWIRQELPGLRLVFRNQGAIGEFFLFLQTLE